MANEIMEKIKQASNGLLIDFLQKSNDESEYPFEVFCGLIKLKNQ
ncbi:MAG: hypothetical protein RM347_034880 [Nostoc sp. ChiQUE02]|nr:hypothetical protein [Nostoc sp. ChiQUE02]